MGKQYKTFFRMYAAWDFKRELEDLNRRSEQGWQLVKGGLFASRFEHNPNLRYRYQLDFRRVTDMPRYLETFREQGWEYVNSTFNDWHNADEKDWKCARWMDYLSGIDFNVKLPDKTIVCGHRSTRYGNSGYLNIEDPDRLFDPFYYAGLIAIDATTVLSGKVNCIILEDD